MQSCHFRFAAKGFTTVSFLNFIYSKSTPG
nr:MAG TPA_asm: hypothetical protein [Caudoviricetes sp.]